MLRDGLGRLNGYLRIDAALLQATERLSAVSESPRLDAELLLSRALDVQRSYLFAHPDDEMDAQAMERFEGLVARRADGMPLAYITGIREFWSMPLVVTKDVLVPRPETELLVEQALCRLPKRSTASVLDLGTGSGAIALAIAKERPSWTVVATDIDDDAIVVARENARRQSLPNIEFLVGSWIEPVASRQFDLVVSNPPYVAADDPALRKLRHEPRHALVSGDDGLDAIRHIATAAGTVLRPGGDLLLEHGHDQHGAVRELLGDAGWKQIEARRDLAGHERITVARLPD